MTKDFWENFLENFLEFLPIQPIYDFHPSYSFCDFFHKNCNLGSKMKVLKFFGIQPSYFEENYFQLPSTVGSYRSAN